MSQKQLPSIDVVQCPRTDSKTSQEYAISVSVTESIVKVTSREMIKPSSPTPNDKKIVYLSLIDQIVPLVYNSILLFFQNDPNNNNNHLFNTIEKRSKLLKQSLSEILVDFYPLAGRVRENELINCNDEGVEFCEANITSNKTLTQFIENPSVLELRALLPFQGNSPNHTNIVLSIQVNHFCCGGMALGACFTHKITDGAALTDFLIAWSTKTRYFDHVISTPGFNGASLLPPLTQFNEMNLNPPPVREGRIGIKRLIFDKKMIDELKVDSTTIRPSTNEVVTAFIWKNLPKISLILQFVNLRMKMRMPIIPPNSFGNFAWFTKTSSTPTLTPLCFIDELRKNINKIDNDYIRDLIFNDGSSMTKLKKEIYEVCRMTEDCLFITNYSKFPVYEVDFGMGKPIWACLPSTFVKNLSLVMSTPCGDGVEVWVCMLEDDIETLDEHSFSHLGHHPIVKHVRLD
ncbi:hypothetical protein RND81_04G093200 [Saponaria officinalis]|uniref:Uncharacterized protein n=1 Tax=Saponaria officinalis TaxID=3572 RepID=A0AAW1LJK1_SAPOF